MDDSSDWEVVTLISARPSCGIGTALIDAAVDRARAAGCRRLWLVTTNENTVAQHFYRSRGWSEVEVHLGAVRLARELKPEIPLVGQNGAPIEDEIEFELGLRA
ncbi:MAG: GNAT family N-acetyltransferase [Actinomycetia bacterium]|nr:GNAT family N-acetyltransferase [Actinomycetes bacterium]